MRTLPFVLANLIALSTAAAQSADQDIYLAPLRVADGKIQLGTPRNITNRAGYDNQPHFTRDGQSILFTARVDDAQTDIFRYDLRGERAVRVTQTPESEYSPTPLTRGGFAVIRVEADSTQRLWRFDDDGTRPSVLLPNVKPVGYQAWIDERTVVMFVLGRPATLRIGDLQTGRADSIAANIDRAIQKVPQWAGASFVQRTADSALWILRVHGQTRAIQPIAPLPPAGVYHAWTPSGNLLATAGAQVLEWVASGSGGSWRVVADASDSGLRWSRIAVSPQGDWVALVGERAR